MKARQLSRPDRRLLVSVAVAALAGAFAQNAPAASVTVDRACYSRGDTAKVNLSGMPPGETIALNLDLAVVSEVPIDANGNGSTTFEVPRGRPPLPMKVRAQISLDILAETTFRLDAPFVRMSPKRAKPTSRIRYRLSGFARSGPIYVHVVRGSKRVRRVTLGKPKTRCGELVKRIEQLPLRRPRKGTYVVQFDQYRKYVKKRKASVRRTVRVRFASKTRR